MVVIIIKYGEKTITTMSQYLKNIVGSNPPEKVAVVVDMQGHSILPNSFELKQEIV